MERLYVIPILLFSVVIHEVAHGYVALKLGDPTARDMGRITFNPIPHIDLFGSIIMPLLAFVANFPFLLAWAKPVPINPQNFKVPRRDDILVSVAGPFSNFITAFFCVIGYVLVKSFTPMFTADENDFALIFTTFLAKMFAAGITLNVFLAVFNLIPIPPLDGSHIVASLLPESIAQRYRELGFLGLFLVIFFLNIPAAKQFLIDVVKIATTPYILLIKLFQ